MSSSTSWSQRSSRLWMSPAFLYRMQILAGFESQKFGGEGRSRQRPRSRTGARPRQAADSSDPVTPTIDRDGLPSSLLYAACRRIFMRHHDIWGLAFAPGAGSSGEFRLRRTAPYVESYKRTSEKTSFYNVG